MKKQYQNMPRHYLSQLFGSMSDKDKESLKQDIATNGLRHKEILVHDGKVLDGWHRYQAVLEINQSAKEPIDLEFRECDDDPALQRMAVSENMHRRHISKRERAWLMVMIHDWNVKMGRPTIAVNAIKAREGSPWSNEDQTEQRDKPDSSMKEKVGQNVALNSDDPFADITDENGDLKPDQEDQTEQRDKPDSSMKEKVGQNVAPSRKAIAQMAGVSTKTVDRALKDREKLGANATAEDHMEMVKKEKAKPKPKPKPAGEDKPTYEFLLHYYQSSTRKQEGGEFTYEHMKWMVKMRDKWARSLAKQVKGLGGDPEKYADFEKRMKGDGKS